jgi:hypothetical protein
VISPPDGDGWVAVRWECGVINRYRVGSDLRILRLSNSLIAPPAPSAEGQLVTLVPNFDLYGDAKDGPLTLGDIGEVVRVGARVRVQGTQGKEWWYDKPALRRVIDREICVDDVVTLRAIVPIGADDSEPEEEDDDAADATEEPLPPLIASQSARDRTPAQPITTPTVPVSPTTPAVPSAPRRSHSIFSSGEIGTVVGIDKNDHTVKVKTERGRTGWVKAATIRMAQLRVLRVGDSVVLSLGQESAEEVKGTAMVPGVLARVMQPSKNATSEPLIASVMGKELSLSPHIVEWVSSTPSIGDIVTVTEEYKQYGDAANGPLKPGEPGEIIKVDGSGKPLKVRALNGGERSYWYMKEAIVKIAEGNKRRVVSRIRDEDDPADGLCSVM